ncbi:50S ribosomal protein L10 [Patescibacteria group bacterium]|nr:50S ribosomal protein L10 [Patescibacteria group bacterium]
MPKTKAQKADILRELSQNLDKQLAMVFVDVKGLDVKNISVLRKELRQNGAQLVVVKKTLLQKALTEKKIQADLKQMEGQIAAVFAYEDPLSAIQKTHTFAKRNEHLKIVGGYFEGEVQEATQIVALANLPSKEELLAMLVLSIAAPLSRFANVLQGNIKGLVVVLGAIGNSKQ